MGHIEILSCIGSNVLVIVQGRQGREDQCVGVLLAVPCFGEEGDRPSAGSMVLCSYILHSVLGRPTSHNTAPVRPSQLFVGQRAQLALISGYWCTITDALSLFQLPGEACQ